VIIGVLSGFVRDPIFSRFVALTVWVIAALNILGWLDAAIALLDSVAMSFGDLRISLLVVIKAVLSLAVLLWVATLVSAILERRIKGSPNLTPSVKVLFSKLLQITLIFFAFVAALSSVGIDLTAFTVFGGAVGVGIGFGLQKIVSNLISGIILLLDKSIKPGDVITVGDYYGAVNSLGARYVSVITRDGIEHLIPNEDLIVNRVENWSYSDNNIRLKAPIGVHYKADIHRARELCLQAASAVTRVLSDPPPVCLLRGFGDSSVDLELRFWICDPQNGRANVTSEVLFGVWDRFRENGIEIPYPQRDIHVRTPEDIERILRELRSPTE
jgi:small-conductance mechanosensitive channel